MDTFQSAWRLNSVLWREKFRSLDMYPKHLNFLTLKEKDQRSYSLSILAFLFRIRNWVRDTQTPKLTKMLLNSPVSWATPSYLQDLTLTQKSCLIPVLILSKRFYLACLEAVGVGNLDYLDLPEIRCYSAFS